MWTVTPLWPQVVTAHLLGGFATLSLLFLLTLRLAGSAATLPKLPARLRSLAALGPLLVIGRSPGGWVSSNYAAAALRRFADLSWRVVAGDGFRQRFHLTQHIGPNYLGGQLDSDARTAIHMTHRLASRDPGAAAAGLATQTPWFVAARRFVGAGAGRTDQPGH
jgi:cytochrome c oxidase assembly protein subunit 15